MCITNPEKENYPYIEAIKTHLIFSDEFIVVDGGSNDGSLQRIYDNFGEAVRVVKMDWPQGKGKWTWEEFAKHWQRGFDSCTGDWVCAAECDHVFQESEAEKVKAKLAEHGVNKAVVFLDKLVSSTWDKWQSKSKFSGLVNKGQFPNIGYGLDRDAGSKQDLANPIFVKEYNGEFGIPEGQILKVEDGHNLGVYMMNYDKTFKTKEQIIESREAANCAWNNSCLVKLGLADRWEDEAVLEDVLSRMNSRYANSPVNKPDFKDHPACMQELLSNINENHLGFNLFGSIK